MIFEKKTTQEPQTFELEQEKLVEQVENNLRLRELIGLAFKDLISSNLKRCKKNAAEVGMSLGMQSALIALFLNENIGSLNSYFNISGDGTIFVDRRIIAVIISGVLVKSASILKDYLKKHESSTPALEPTF